MNTQSIHPMNGCRAPAPNKLAAQTRAHVAAKELGIKLHAADVLLGRVPDRQWAQVPTDERDVYIQRGALALRLTDQVQVAIAVAAATQAVFAKLDRSQGHPCASSAELATDLTQLATTRFIASLARGR